MWAKTLMDLTMTQNAKACSPTSKKPRGTKSKEMEKKKACGPTKKKKKTQIIAKNRHPGGEKIKKRAAALWGKQKTRRAASAPIRSFRRRSAGCPVLRTGDVCLDLRGARHEVWGATFGGGRKSRRAKGSAGGKDVVLMMPWILFVLSGDRFFFVLLVLEGFVQGIRSFP